MWIIIIWIIIILSYITELIVCVEKNIFGGIYYKNIKGEI